MGTARNDARRIAALRYENFVTPTGLVDGQKTARASTARNRRRQRDGPLAIIVARADFRPTLVIRGCVPLKIVATMFARRVNGEIAARRARARTRQRLRPPERRFAAFSRHHAVLRSVSQLGAPSRARPSFPQAVCSSAEDPTRPLGRPSSSDLPRSTARRQLVRAAAEQMPGRSRTITPSTPTEKPRRVGARARRSRGHAPKSARTPFEMNRRPPIHLRLRASSPRTAAALCSTALSAAASRNPISDCSRTGFRTGTGTVQRPMRKQFACGSRRRLPVQSVIATGLDGRDRAPSAVRSPYTVKV